MTWGEPRPGTEAFAVQQEVQRKKKIAQDKGLDKLLSEVYHEKGLRNYEAWITNDRNKRWVHPSVSEIVNGEDIVGRDKIPFVEFKMAAQKYKVTSRRWLGEGGDVYNDLTLYMNGLRVFEVGEVENDDRWGGCSYRPVGVQAYVNEDWVGDFRQLELHHKKITEQSSIEFAEDKKRLQETKDAFGITTLPGVEPAKTVPPTIVPPTIAPPLDSSKGTNRIAIWIVVAILAILAVWWSNR